MKNQNLSIAIVGANYWTVFYLALGIGLLFYLPLSSIGTTIGVALAWIYLVPPLLARAIIFMAGKPEADTKPGEPTYMVWWLLTQIQMLYNRIVLLEEILRLIPALYPLWLRLWGSKVSLFFFCSPGVVFPDRYLLEIGKGTVIGSRCIISGHLLSKGMDGGYQLTIGKVWIGEHVILGSDVGIAPGCRIDDHELVPATKYLPPYSIWRHGKRLKSMPDKQGHVA